jgi:hypothetical protein
MVGKANGALVSLYEWGRRLPSLRTALALEILFGVPVGQLFVGALEAIEQKTELRLKKLESTLQNTCGTGSPATTKAKKLVWLTGRKMDLSDE